MTQKELDAATTAVRALVDEKAGWYAHMISDEMVAAVSAAAINAAEKARATTKT